MDSLDCHVELYHKNNKKQGGVLKKTKNRNDAEERTHLSDLLLEISRAPNYIILKL